MKKITPKYQKISSFLLLSFLILSLVSCSTSQNTASDDGIYGEDTYYPRQNEEEVTVIKDKQSAVIYQNYFETESKKYDFDEEDIITDVDEYEGYEDTEGNVTINNYYVEGTPPWDYSTDVSVSFHLGFGGYYGSPCGGYYGGWGYPYYGYGYGCGGYWGGYWGGYPWYGGGYYPPYYPGYPGYYPPYYPGYPGYYPPYYGGDYTYGKRSTYNTRPWARNSTAYNYQRSSSTGKRYASSNIYSKAARESTTRASNYQRNAKSGSTRDYSRSTVNNKSNTRRSYNRSTRSTSPSYNRSNSTRSSSPSYRSSGSSGVRSSGGSSRGRHQASNSDTRTNNYNTSRAYADRTKITRVANVNYNPNRYVRNNRTKYTSTAGKTSNNYRVRDSRTGTSKYTTQRYVSSNAKKSSSTPRRTYSSNSPVRYSKSNSYKKSNSGSRSYSRSAGRSSAPSSARSSSYSRSSGGSSGVRSSGGGSRSSGRSSTR